MPDRDPSPPGEASPQRKLAAILSADVAGYSRLMGVDEAGTHERLMAHRALVEGAVAAHRGRVVGTAGDSVLADFPSVVQALSAAVAAQRALGEANQGLDSERRLEFRVGINLGDVIVEGDDIFGDGVNVAARLEALAAPGGICVSDKVYEEVKNKLDLRFDDRGAHRVKNIAEPIHVYAVDTEGVAIRPPAGAASRSRRLWGVAAAAAVALAVWALWFSGSEHRRPTTRPDPAESSATARSDAIARAAIAVLPFENQSREETQSYFRDGVTQDIIGALGRFSNLRMMSWEAVSPYRDATPTLAQVAGSLGVRYVVRGSVRRGDERIRVAVRLTDARSGDLIWSEHYDSDLEDLFAVQEEITEGIVGALAVQISAVEQKRATATPTDNLDAYDYVLRGRQHFARETRPENVKARALFEEAVSLAPDYADARVDLGWTHHHDAAYGWMERPERSIERAHDLAQEALRLDPGSSSAHTLLSNVHIYRHRHDLALAEIDRAIALNPNDAEAYAWRGWILLALGRIPESIESSELALRFNPNSPPSSAGNLGWAYFLEGRYDDAVAMLESSMGQHPDVLFGQAALAAAYAAAGRDAEAARAAADVERLQPFFEAEPFGELFLDESDRRRVIAALRRAGLE